MTTVAYRTGNVAVNCFYPALKRSVKIEIFKILPYEAPFNRIKCFLKYINNNNPGILFPQLF